MDTKKIVKDTEALISLILKAASSITNKKIKNETEKWVNNYYGDLINFLSLNSGAVKALRYLTKSINNQRLSRKKWLKNLGIVKKSLNSLKFIEGKQILIFDPNKPFTAYQILKDLFSKAKKEVFVFDGYVEEGTLEVLSDIPDKIKLKILTNNTYGKFLRELPKFKKEFSSCEVRKSNIVHDRFFIIDDKCFISGTSLHAVGSKKSSYIFETDKAVGEILKNHFHNIWNQSNKI